jgi:8-oxo-dGTP pyrophosphatase MutT (NUDIX family)
MRLNPTPFGVLARLRVPVRPCDDEAARRGLAAGRWADEEGAMDPVFRRAARLLVIDPDDSVLLFQYEDDRRRWWATPGGGLESDETFEQAAAREAAEELSLTLMTFTPLWCLTVDFSFRGQSIHQVESYFLVRVSREDLGLGEIVSDAHRREGIVAAHWWSLEEIETTSEQVFPENLCERVRGLRPR